MADNGQNLIYIFIFFVLIGSFLIIVNKTYKNKNIISKKFKYDELTILTMVNLKGNFSVVRVKSDNFKRDYIYYFDKQTTIKELEDFLNEILIKEVF